MTAVPHYRKAATHDSEIRSLYEEMEAQIKNEKDRLHLKVPAEFKPEKDVLLSSRIIFSTCPVLLTYKVIAGLKL